MENIWERLEAATSAKRTAPVTPYESIYIPRTTTPTPKPVVTTPTTSSTPKAEEGETNLWTKIGEFISAPYTRNVEGYKAQAEKPSFGEYVGRKAVGGAADTAEGVANAFGYWYQDMVKSGELQHNNALRHAAATAKDPEKKAAMETYLDKMGINQKQAEDITQRSTKTVANFADNYMAETEEKFADADFGIVGNAIGDVAQGVGGMAARMPTRLVPGLGEVATFASAYGNAKQNALKNGAIESEASTYALGTAAIELATEKLFGFVGGLGNGFVDNKVAGLIGKAASKFANSEAVKTALNVISGAAGEGFEELIAELAQSYIDKLTIKTDERNFRQVLGDGAYNALIGGLTGLLFSTASAITGGDGKLPPKQEIEEVAAQAAAQTNAEIAQQSAKTEAPAEAQISPSGGVSGNAANVTRENESANPDYQGEGIAQDGARNANAIGVGGAHIDSVATEQPYKTAPNRDQSTTRNIFGDAEMAAEDTGTHRVIGAKERRDTWEGMFERDEEGNISNLSELVDTLMAIPNWTASETDAANTLAYEARRQGDMDTYRTLKSARRDAMGEAARILQSQQPWIAVAESGDNIMSAAVEAVEGLDNQTANATLQVINGLAAKFDKAGGAGTEGSTANVVRDIRHTAAQDIAEVLSSEGAARDTSGEPFVFEYAQKVGESVAKGVRRSAAAPKTKTFLESMAAVLRRFASEKLPKSSAKPLTPIEVLRDYVQNADFYAEAWGAMQNELRDTMGAEAFDSLINSGIDVNANMANPKSIFARALVAAAAESGETQTQIKVQSALGLRGIDALIANNLIQQTGAEGEMAQTIRDAASHYVNNVLGKSTEADADKIVQAKIKAAMKDIGSTLNNAANLDSAQRGALRSAITSLLVNKYGFDGADSAEVTNVVGEYFDKMVEAAARKQIEQYIAPRAKRGEPESTEDKLLRLANLGAFDSDLSQAVSEKLLGEGSAAIDSEFVKGLSSAQQAEDYMVIIREVAKMRHTTGIFSGKFAKQADWALNRIAERGDIDFLRRFAANSILSIATDQKGSTAGEKITTVRRLAMLSKASTIMRNLVSNGVFDGIDTLARDLSVPLDRYISKRTGTRSVAVDKGFASEAKRQGTLDALAKSYLEVGLDVDATGSQGRYESTSNRAFKMSGGPVSKLFSTMEKLSGYALVTTDAMAQGGTSAEIQRGIDDLYNRGLIRDDSLTDAGKTEAEYRTFQDKNKLSGAALDARRAFDKIKIGGENGVGLGQLTVPFAKTPTNLAVRAVEYSPVGLINSGKELASVMIRAKTGKDFTAAEQAKAVQGIGRGFTGTTLIGLAVWGALAGVIRSADAGTEDDDKDKAAYEKMTGMQGTQFNASAFIRGLSGDDTDWRDDDILISIGFLEPLNAHLISGVLIAEDIKNDELTFKSLLSDSVVGALQSIMDMPLMQSFKEIGQMAEYAEGDNLAEKGIDVVTQYAASQIPSFIPNAVKGFAQGIDPIQRNTYASDNIWQQTWDNIKSSIPFARQTVAPKLDSFGNEMRNEGGALGFLNANILPGQITRYNEQAGQRILDSIFEATGDASIYPDRKAPNKIEDVALSPEAKAQYMETAGSEHEELLTALEGVGEFDDLGTKMQAEVLDMLRKRAQSLAKDEFKKANGIEFTTSKTEAAIRNMTADEFIRWCISDVSSSTPAYYENDPTWQTFERAADVLPTDTAISMMIATSESAGKKVEQAYKEGVSLDAAVAYYRAINERVGIDGEGKPITPKGMEKARRINALGLTAEERVILTRIFG